MAVEILPNFEVLALSHVQRTRRTFKSERAAISPLNYYMSGGFITFKDEFILGLYYT